MKSARIPFGKENKGGPEKVKGDFDCSRNQITSLKGAPKKVKGHFNCSGNQLTTLDCGLKKVGGDFICADNAMPFTEEQVRSTYKIKGIFLAD